MNDTSIRQILIAYLKTMKRKSRIYQEKSIGSSICDVMVVTDKLTGYEIKSDADNYQRLDSQIKSYDRFFDENYLVVSEKHLHSATDKVPKHWGVLCVRATNVEVVRKAKKNPNVRRRSQLTILWKLELKNLLIKNSLPLFAQKDKDFIAAQIDAAVQSDLLGKQIAQELMARDYSQYDREDPTVYSDSEQQLPVQELVDMLSEQNLQQLTLDKWIDLYRQATTVQEQKEVQFQAPVEDRVPHTISYKDIEVSLGVPWVSPQIICDFVKYILGNRSKDYHTAVHYEPVTGNWSIPNKGYLADRNPNATIKYGLPRYNALQIIEASLNLREIKLFDNGHQYNEQDTLAALEKQRLIDEKFKVWIWADPDRRWEVEEAYNKIFGQYDRRQYDGSGLVFEDMSPAFSLFDYQKDAVQKILTTPNTLLAFDVGAGKTFIMIAAAMKMRAEGFSRKNFFVVPNHIVGQWEKIFTDLYPNAKVLAVEPKSFKPAMRQKVLTQIRDGDYDGIIMAYSCFEMIPLSENVVLDDMQKHLQRLEEAVHDLRTRTHAWNCQSAVDRERARLKKMTREFLDSMDKKDTGGITFDQLEINTLFVDEAHNYKNLPIRTTMKNLNGINTKGSMKCLDLLHKVRHVQSANDGRGVVFATGTPLCNSISDAYSMQMYLQYDQLVETHLDVFDNWVKTFAKPEQLCEIDVDTSKFRFIRKFVKFFNLPELSKMFAQIAIFHAIDDSENLPELEGYTDQVIKKYPELTDYMKTLCTRTEAIRGKLVKPSEDNMLKVSTDGRKAALHLKLVGEEQPDGEHSKVFCCVENVKALYDQHPNTTQLIFCDYSTPKTEQFNVYDEIKERLVAQGIPENEIAFIHHYHTESRKVELFRKFNAGKVRILIGSTFKLGIGANVQAKLKAVHHLDVPWRPADMVQREGRILRRGNENKEVLIYRYIVEGSFDSYSWQILETKQRFITQFLTGSTYQRSVADLESNVLTYAEVKALALAEPLMKQLAEKENEIKNLRIILSSEKQSREKAATDYHICCEQVANTRKRWTTSLTAVGHLSKYRAEAFKDVYDSLKDFLTPEWIAGGDAAVPTPELLGFKLERSQHYDENKPFVLLRYYDQRYLVDMGDSPSGNARRVVNVLKGFQKIADRDKENLDNAVTRKAELKKIMDNPNRHYEKKIKELEEETAQLRDMITNAESA